MANTLQTTLRDIGEIVASVKDNQSYLIDALNRTAEVSANMVEATAGIPRLVEHIDAVLVRLDRTLASVDGQASSLGSDLGDLMAQTSDLTVSLTALVEAVEPSARRSPVLIDNLTQVSREAEVLLNRLNHHWLLGGDEQVARPGPRLDMPGDDALYSGGGLNQKGGRNE